MRKNRHMNNKGAALVMVILAMMFVGIIAAIALTLTVGNSKSTKATIDTSENFYSSENVLNDLEMYLKKLATDSATKAYAEALVNMEPGKDTEQKFEEAFADAILDMLKGDGTNPGKLAGDNVGTGNSFKLSLLKEICYDRYDLTTNTEYTDDNKPVDIRYEKIEKGSDGKVIIKNVVITLRENGYESTITTDITFDARMPRTGKLDASSDFGFAIDHHLIIAGDSIKPIGYLPKSAETVFTRSTNGMKGTYTGNIYAFNDFIIQTKAGSDNAVNLKSYSVVVGNDIIVDKSAGVDGNGNLNIEPINNDAILYENGTKFGTKVWSDNIKVYDGNVSISGNGTLLADTYLGGNLELNGNSSSFTVTKGGEFVGFSYGGASTDITSTGKIAPKSSAIILNGLGSTLNLSDLNSLTIGGTAYTAISSLGNLDTYYSDYNASDTELGNLNYYTQGESITYRALQALYLVPGYCLTDIGHNPLLVSEVSGTLKVEVPADLQEYLDPDKMVEFHKERYVGTSDDKVYVLWTFKDKESAVDYVNYILARTADKRNYNGKDLADKQISMLATNGGGITLPTSPSSTVSLFGNGVYLEGGKIKTIEGGGTSSSLDSAYKGWLSNADGNKSGSGNSILANMFTNNELTTYAGGTQKEYTLLGPLDENINSEGKALTYDLAAGPINNSGTLLTNYKNDHDYANQTDRKKYVLVTGDNINWSTSFATDTTYIFITPGNVTISSTSVPFRGMIIAGGSVILPDGLDMKCLGMLSYIQYVAGVKQGQIDTTEFQALLSVKTLVKNASNEYEEDSSSGNYKLRQIFNVADTSSTGGNGTGDDFVTLLTSEWKRN